MKPVSLVYGGDINPNLDQAMSKKKKKKKKWKYMQKNTHNSLGLTGQHFAFGRNFW